MKELEKIEKGNKQSSLICSICNNKNLYINQRNTKLKKVINDSINVLDLSELIKKCNCFTNNNNAYAHKYCLIYKIIYNFEIKCEKCNTVYKIEINKRTKKSKKMHIILVFLIIYIIHLIVYLFCMFLLFINIILKEYILIIFKHIFYFFGIIIFMVNSILLYFSIINNIKRAQNEIYNYSIKIHDIIKKNDNFFINDNNNESVFYKLIFEFYQWFHGKQLEDLLNNIIIKNMINKGNNLYNNTINGYINKNNIEIAQFKENKKNIKKEIDLQKEENKNKINYINDNANDIIFVGFDKSDNNSNIDLKNMLNLNNNKKNKLQENNDYYNKEDLKIHKYNNNNNDIKNNNNNINNINSINNFYNNSNSNNFIIKKLSSNNIESCNKIEENQKLKHPDFINININPRNSKNISINIHFSNDRSSLIEFSSSKENNYQFNKKKIGKSALIPKNLMMSNIISEANSIKRKRRLLKSIKIRQNKINLKGTSLPGGSIREDEEIDFSVFDKTATKLTRLNKKSIIFSRNDSELKNSYFRAKNSFKDIDFNISNSDIGGMEGNCEQNCGEQNFRNSVKNNTNGKHVHFAD